MNTYDIYRLETPEQVVSHQQANSPEEALEKEARQRPDSLLDTTLLTLLDRDGAPPRQSVTRSPNTATHTTVYHKRSQQTSQTRKEVKKMPARKNPKTAFGLELLQFCARNGITYKQVAAAADVKHSTLVECTTGRCAGHELIPKVRRYMEDYEASISTNRT